MSVCFSLFLDNYILNGVKFSTHLNRKWVSEWVGKEVSSIVFKVIGNIVCLFCFVSGQFTLNGVIYSIYYHRNHRNEVSCGGGNVVCLFFFVSGQIHFEWGHVYSTYA